MGLAMSGRANGSIDVRLMRTLHVLLAECSVTRTAEILGQSQPKVSLALRRLREMFDDPLLVRSGSNLVPTERGAELRSSMGNILSEIDKTFAPEPEFEPATSAQHFRVVSTRSLGFLFLPLVTQRLRASAPHASFEFGGLPRQNDLVAVLERGDADIVISNAPNPPEHLRTAPLFSADIVCMVNLHHPLARAKRLTLEEYLRLDHLSPTPIGHERLSPIDGRLVELGRRRRIAVSLPEYGLVPQVLVGTDLVFTTGRPFAEHMAATMPFSILEAPLEFGAMHFYTLWHERNHRAASHRWLRTVLREIAGDLRQIVSTTSVEKRSPATAG